MAIKTKEELFGDDGVWGPRVPISETNPPGTSAGNRAVQFGEPVRSSVANRIAYALAINDEDLDARITAFETTGLDAAYRLGLELTAGGGRLIELDGGAVETQSAYSAEYQNDASNAHFRANSTGDTSGSSIGFEQRGRATAGFLFADPIGVSLYSNLLSQGMSATLNPGGAGTDRVELLGGVRQVADGSGNTDLIMRTDLAYVTVAGETKLYILYGLSGQYTATLTTLQGNDPGFAADTAATISFARVRFGAFSAGNRSEQLQGNIFVGNQSIPTALSLVPGAASAEDTAFSPTALKVFRRELDGFLYEAFKVGNYGEVKVTLRDSADAANILRDALRFGPPAFLVDTRDNTYTTPALDGLQCGLMGHYFGGAVFYGSISTYSLPVVFDADPATQEGFSASFLAGTNDIQLAVMPTTTLAAFQALCGGGALLECTSSSVPTQRGFYWLVEQGGANDIYSLRSPSAATPSFAAATGTWRIHVLSSSTGNFLPGWDPTQWPTSSSGGSNAGAPHAFRDDVDIHGELRGFVSDPGVAPTYRREAYRLDADGIETMGSVMAEGDVVSVDGNVEAVAGFVTGGDLVAVDRIRFLTPLARSYVIGPAEGNLGDTPGWRLSTLGYLFSLANSASVIFPLRFSHSMYIETIDVLINPGTTHNMFISLHKCTLDWVTPAQGVETTIDSATINTSPIQVVTLDNGAGGDIGSYDPAETWYIRVRSGTSGSSNIDELWGIRVNGLVEDVIE